MEQPEDQSTVALVEILWSDRVERRRGPRPRLSRDDVVAAAIALADGEGFDAVTMQRVADAVGAAKMGLYRYVPGKAELAALMVDHALGAPPAVPDGRWRDGLRTWATAMRERMAAHPWTLELTLGPRVPGPNELAWFEAGLAALRSTPLDGAQRLDVLALLTEHVRGSVQQAARTDRPESALADALGPVLARHGEHFPATVRAFADAAATGGRDDAFRFGLDLVVRGVEALVRDADVGVAPAPTPPAR